MCITTLTRPCWTFTCRREETAFVVWREHRPHPAQLDTHRDRCCRPYELDSACVEVTCDCCAIALGGTGASYEPRHFPTVAGAGEHLAGTGWTTDGHAWHCEDCPVLHDLTHPSTAA